MFIVLATEMVSYYEKRDDMETTSKLALRLLEHLYYKPEPAYAALKTFAEGKLRDADELAARLAADAAAAKAAADEKARLEAERARAAEEEGDEYLDDEDADEAEAKEASEIPYPTGVTFPRVSARHLDGCRSSSTKGATAARRRARCCARSSTTVCGAISGTAAT